MVLLVFAGCAAEFPLNRAVDWLFFTGKLPGDPLGRLFATAGYAQQIVFAEELTACRTLDRIRAVHEAVERQRGQAIPDWAYRDVLYMLVDYSERAHELLAGPLRPDEQDELYSVFYRIGTRIGISGLPLSYVSWRVDRECHMRRDLLNSAGTEALYFQYRKHLGAFRYQLLLRLQAILAPEYVRCLLRLESAEWLRPLLRVYAIVVGAWLRCMVQRLVMPSSYLAEVRRLDEPRLLHEDASHERHRRVSRQRSPVDRYGSAARNAESHEKWSPIDEKLHRARPHTRWEPLIRPDVGGQRINGNHGGVFADACSAISRDGDRDGLADSSTQRDLDVGPVTEMRYNA
jgi:hypothetical protein